MEKHLSLVSLLIHIQEVELSGGVAGQTPLPHNDPKVSELEP